MIQARGPVKYDAVIRAVRVDGVIGTDVAALKSRVGWDIDVNLPGGGIVKLTNATTFIPCPTDLDYEILTRQEVYADTDIEVVKRGDVYRPKIPVYPAFEDCTG